MDDWPPPDPVEIYALLLVRGLVLFGLATVFTGAVALIMLIGRRLWHG